MQQFDITIQRRQGSDLLMATIEDIPGFIVHAYSLDELEGKLASEFKTFMDATDRPVGTVEVIRRETSADFWPPAFIARATMVESAA